MKHLAAIVVIALILTGFVVISRWAAAQFTGEEITAYTNEQTVTLNQFVNQKVYEYARDVVGFRSAREFTHTAVSGVTSDPSARVGYVRNTYDGSRSIISTGRTFDIHPIKAAELVEAETRLIRKTLEAETWTDYLRAYTFLAKEALGQPSGLNNLSGTYRNRIAAIMDRISGGDRTVYVNQLRQKINGLTPEQKNRFVNYLNGSGRFLGQARTWRNDVSNTITTWYLKWTDWYMGIGEYANNPMSNSSEADVRQRNEQTINQLGVATRSAEQNRRSVLDQVQKLQNYLEHPESDQAFDQAQAAADQTFQSAHNTAQNTRNIILAIKPGKVGVQPTSQPIAVLPPGIFGQPAGEDGFGAIGPETLLEKIRTFLFDLSIPAFILLVILGGLLMILAPFSKGYIDLGKKYIYWAIIGYIVLLVASAAIALLRSFFGGR